MAEAAATALVDRPSSGRIHDGQTTVTIGDADPGGRCRLDALLRFGQDVARSDWVDSGVDEPSAWLARRILLEIRQWPVLDERLHLHTWCSGYGARWAERRTSFTGECGASVESAALWVHVDTRTGRPSKLTDSFFEFWGESAAGRRVSARTQLPGQPPGDAERSGWPVRFADLDLIGHVNNAAQCAAFEEVLFRTQPDVGPLRAEIEFGASLEHDSDVNLCWVPSERGVDAWLAAADGTATAARIRLDSG